MCTCIVHVHVCVHVNVDVIFYRVHAGIDEMDVFINIDLNTFLDVKMTCTCICTIKLYMVAAYETNYVRPNGLVTLSGT